MNRKNIIKRVGISITIFMIGVVTVSATTKSLPFNFTGLSKSFESPSDTYDNVSSISVNVNTQELSSSSARVKVVLKKGTGNSYTNIGTSTFYSSGSGNTDIINFTLSSKVNGYFKYFLYKVDNGIKGTSYMYKAS